MYKSLTIPFSLALLIGVAAGGALADDTNSSSSMPGPGGGFPNLMQGAGGQFLRALGVRSQVPRPKDVLAISSLSQDQRTKIESIYRESMQQLRPLMQQHKALRQQMQAGSNSQPGIGGVGASGGGAGGSGGPDGREQLFALMREIRTTKASAWNKVQPLLSQGQMQELDQIRNSRQQAGGRGAFNGADGLAGGRGQGGLNGPHGFSGAGESAGAAGGPGNFNGPADPGRGMDLDE